MVKNAELPMTSAQSHAQQVIFNKHRIFKSYTHLHVVVFCLTFILYGMLHANRKSFSNVKVLISEEWTPSTKRNDSAMRQLKPDDIWNSHNFFSSSTDANCKTFLGALDTIFMLAYAAGLLFFGTLGDRINLRYVLCIGMWSTAVTIFLFAYVGEVAMLYNYYWYSAIWCLNGFLQGAGWPAVVAIMGNWFGRSHSGLIFGIWSSNASVGNIIGSVIASSFVTYGYDFAMIVPATILFALAVVAFFGLVITPIEIGLPPPTKPEHPPTVGSGHGFTTSDDNGSAEATVPIVSRAESENNGDQDYLSISAPTNSGSVNIATDMSLPSETRSRNTSPLPGGSAGDFAKLIPNNKGPKAVGLLEALLLPGVITYSVAYACLKLVNYSFFFWLPYYLNAQFHWTQAVADNLSVWYDVGGIFGGILGGVVSDRLKRAPVMFTMLLCSIPIILLYRDVPNDQVVNAIVLAILGFFVGGVANIISATICADLGRHPKLQNTSALSTVTGIVDGAGSIGAAVGQLLIPIMEVGLGWDAVFYMFVISLVLTALCISPIVYREIKETSLPHKFLTCWRRMFNTSSSNSPLAVED